MKTTHTPGPWKVVLGETSDDPFCIFQDDGIGNGDHIKLVAGDPETEANIKLISAAPKLLAVLEMVLGGINSGHIRSHAILDRTDWNAKEWPVRSLAEIVANAVREATAQPPVPPGNETLR